MIKDIKAVDLGNRADNLNINAKAIVFCPSCRTAIDETNESKRTYATSKVRVFKCECGYEAHVQVLIEATYSIMG